MNATHIDTDRLAEQAHDGSDWTATDAAHLAGCADCRLELEVIAAAGRLGAAQLAGFDASRVAAGVRRRLAAEPGRPAARVVRHPAWWLAGLAAAAAVVLAVRMGMPNGSGNSSEASQGASVAVSILHELDGLSAPQLEEVLQSIPPATAALEHVEMAPLSNLDANDLERMLRSMEE